MSYDDPFATYEKYPAVSFKNAPIGTEYAGEVIDPPKLVQARDYNTNEPAFWKDGNPKMTVVIGLKLDNGEKKSLWAPKPSAMFRALADAQKEAGKRIENGDRLRVKLTGTKPTGDPKKEDQKLYAAKLSAGTPQAEADPFDEKPPF